MKAARGILGPLLLLLMFCPAPAIAQGRPQNAHVAKTAVNLTGVQPGQKAMAAVVLEIDEGYHAQSRTPLQEELIEFQLNLDENDAVTFGEPIYPQGHIEEYPAPLGKLSVYTGSVTVRVPFEVKPDAPPGPLKISGNLFYQLCDDKVCYPPERPKFVIETSIVPPGTEVEPNEPELFEEQADAEETSTSVTAPPATAPITATTGGPSGPAIGGLEGSNWTARYAFGAAFLAGLLFNIMPCVLPVLPIKAMGFYQAAQQSRARSFLLGVVFALGLISIFTTLAFLVLVFKLFTWGALFSKGWFIWTIVVLLVGFALSLFGWYEFKLPVGTYNFQPRHDTVSGNYLLGGFTAILATPCTAPLLPPLLLWASTQHGAIGVPAIIMVGVGMAFPYLLLSAFPELAKRFPRTGPWSELFKQMMGFMLLAAAAYFAGQRLIHGTGFWWLVVAVIAVGALYLMARSVQLTKNAGPVGVCAVIAVLLLGGSIWWTARITGLTNRPTVVAGTGSIGHFEPYSADAFAKHRAAGKTVLVKFTAGWCLTCQVIEGTVFQDPTVWKSLADHNIVALKVDKTNDNPPGEDLLLQLNPSGGIPLTAIFTPGSQQPIVLSSVYTSSDLLAAIDQASTQVRVAAKYGFLTPQRCLNGRPA